MRGPIDTVLDWWIVVLLAALCACGLSACASPEQGKVEAPIAVHAEPFSRVTIYRITIVKGNRTGAADQTATTETDTSATVPLR